MLKDNEGRWVNQTDENKQMIINFYKSLFKEENLDKAMINIDSCFPFLEAFFRTKLVDIPKPEEIKLAISTIRATKAFGQDGFLALF